MPIRILAPNDPALAAYQEAIEVNNPDDLVLDIVPFAEYRERLDETLNAENAPYEVVFVPGHIWIPELAHAKKLQPLDDLLEALPNAVSDYQPDSLLPLARDETRYNDEQYMLPLFSDGHILFYNPNLAPIDTAVIPANRICEMIGSVIPAPNGHRIALKAHPAEIFLDFLPYLLEVTGGILDEHQQPTFNTPAGIQTLENYAALAQYAPPETHRYGNQEIADALVTGSVAMAATWGGQAAPIYNAAGSIVDHTYRTAVFRAPWNATWGAAIPSSLPKSTQKSTLAALLRLNNPVMDTLVLKHAGSPIRSTSYSDAAMGQYPWLAAQHLMLETAILLPKLPQIGSVLGALYDNVYQAFRGKKEPSAAMADAEAAVLEAL
jgi:multiple sugar transport system substrate-binding protein